MNLYLCLIGIVITNGNVFANVLSQLSAIESTPINLVTLATQIADILVGYMNNIDDIDNFKTQYELGLSNEDAHLTIEALIVKYGFPLEVHEVETKDEYLLTMHRIPRNGTSVFLMHGILASSDDFVISRFAFLLSKDGYDVWMGNARGNKHSRKHKYLNPSQSKFWDFSWNEIGLYDLPAMIDYVLNVTNTNSLIYIGHSQGTTVFFVMASELPEYNDKISVMVALSPTAYTSNTQSPVINLIAPTWNFINVTTQPFEILPDNTFVRKIKDITCGLSIVSEIICSHLFFLLFFNVSFEQFDITKIPVIFGHYPSGCSSLQLLHYFQEVMSGKFAKFDLGSKINKKRYGTKTTVEYPLEKISAPVALIYSEKDLLISHVDVKKTSKRLNNVIDMIEIPQYFNHLDFLYAKDFKTIIYDRVYKILAMYTTNNKKTTSIHFKKRRRT